MNGRTASRGATSLPPPPEVQPADAEGRTTFAERELHARAAQEPREPDEVVSSEDALRGDADAGQDATAVVRFSFLVLLYIRVRRGRADKGEVALKRARVDSRAQRMGGRLGPRLARILGGGLFWAGVFGEAGTEALEELIDGELEDQARAAAQQKQGAAQ